MKTYTIPQAATELQARFCQTSERQLRKWLMEQRLIYRDLSGDYMATALADARYIHTQYGYYNKPMPGNPKNQQHCATVKISERGLDWLDEQLTRAALKSAA